MTTRTAILPWPPALNAAFRSIVRGKHAVPIKSAQYREYEAKVEALLGKRSEGKEFPWWHGEAYLRVEIDLYRPRRIGDIDSPLKVLFDVLNKRLWRDDAQIVELHVFRHDDKGNPRVEVRAHA